MGDRMGDDARTESSRLSATKSVKTLRPSSATTGCAGGGGGAGEARALCASSKRRVSLAISALRGAIAPVRRREKARWKV